VVNAPGIASSLRIPPEGTEGQRMKPRASRTQRNETTGHPSSKHYREPRPELSCSNRAKPASPFVRIGSSSCGSRLALLRSSARLEPYTPSSEPRRTQATAEPLRTGVEPSPLADTLRRECATTGIPAILQQTLIKEWRMGLFFQCLRRVSGGTARTGLSMQ
jgi:hypothetical protein